MSDYRYGSIWLINFEPQVGSEIKKTRPGLIISKSNFNSSRKKVTVLPFSSRQKDSGGTARVFVPKSIQNGLDKNSEIIIIDPATFDKRRLIKHFGILEESFIGQVKKKLKIYLDL